MICDDSQPVPKEMLWVFLKENDYSEAELTEALLLIKVDASWLSHT